MKRIAKVTATCKGPSSRGTFTFTASTPAPDRAGDVIEPNWDLDAYRRNPVILYAHDYGALPVGRAERVWVEGSNLMIEVRFVPRDIDERAWQVQRMYEEGYLHAVSVGFRPLEWSFLDKGGMKVEKSELLEVSCVPVPMNAEALASTTKAAGSLAPIYVATSNPNLRAEWRMSGVDTNKVKAWLAAPIAKGVIVLAGKKEMGKPPMDDAPPVDDKPAEGGGDVASKCDEILKLLTPVNGTIPQESFDRALALINELKGGDAEPEADPAAAPAAGDPIPSGKSIDLSALLAKTVRDAVAHEFDLRAKEFDESRSALVLDDEPENEELERAFASPEFLNGLRDALQGNSR